MKLFATRHTPVKRRILFLCTGNSCRSQMAEAWTRRVWSSLFDVYSAGTSPQGLDPRAVRAMAEAGVDISSNISNHLDDFRSVSFDVVITVCDGARQICPHLPGAARTLHCSFEDPPRLARDAADEEAALVPYRRVRDEIRAFVEDLPELLGLTANDVRTPPP